MAVTGGIGETNSQGWVLMGGTWVTNIFYVLTLPAYY